MVINSVANGRGRVIEGDVLDVLERLKFEGEKMKVLKEKYVNLILPEDADSKPLKRVAEELYKGE